MERQVCIVFIYYQKLTYSMCQVSLVVKYCSMLFDETSINVKLSNITFGILKFGGTDKRLLGQKSTMTKKSQWVWSGNIAIKNCWHRDEESHNNHETPGRQLKQSNQLSSPFKLIAKLEWPQSNAHQNIEQLQNPTMGGNNSYVWIYV